MAFLTDFSKNLLRSSRQFFIILFWFLAWGLNSGLTSNKPTHYLLDYGDYNLICLHYLIRIETIAINEIFSLKICNKFFLRQLRKGNVCPIYLTHTVYRFWTNSVKLTFKILSVFSVTLSDKCNFFEIN